MSNPAAIIGIKSLQSKAASLGAWLMTLGAAGLFGIALLDSAFVPLPGGPDLSMIVLSTVRPQWMPLYALAATAGSVIGSTALYMLARRAGATVLRGVTRQRRARIEGLLGRYDMMAIAVPAILPPPFPFKVFILSAGVFKLQRVRFIVAIVAGRAARFLIEGILAIEFGRDAETMIRQQGVKVLAAVAIGVAGTAGFKYWRSRTRPAMAANEEIRQPGD